MHDLALSQLLNGVQAEVTADSRLNESFVNAWQTYLWLLLPTVAMGEVFHCLKMKYQYRISASVDLAALCKL